MSSSDPTCAAEHASVEQGSHLVRLPTEIREMIYRPLLVAKHTRTARNMTSKEYDLNRSGIQYGPDQTYQFHPALFSTNRRIYEETRNLCQRENDFVCLTSEWPSCLGDELQRRGLQILARESKARGFWNVSMTISLDPAVWAGWPQLRPWETGHPVDLADATGDGEPWSYIFCSDELPEFCRLLLTVSTNYDDVIFNTTFHVDVNPAIGNGETIKIDSNPVGLARLRKLLDPLRQLYGLGYAMIEGPFSESYKEEVIASICEDYPAAVEFIDAAIVSLEHADEQVSKGQITQANLGYKATLSLIRSCYYGSDEQDLILDYGPFPGLTVMQVIHNFAVRLQARIAGVYLESGELRMARIYTERAMDPRRPYDHRYHKQYTLDIDPWEGVAYAEVLHVAARISYRHGNVWEATRNMRDAAKLVPWNQEQESRYQAWEGQAEMLRNKNADRERAMDLRCEKQNEKNEANFLVVCNWKEKGDRLLGYGKPDLACAKYKTALSKLDVVDHRQSLYHDVRSGPFRGYPVPDAIKALRFKLQASVAASYLKSGSYKDILLWTDAALKCSRCIRHCNRCTTVSCREYHDISTLDWAEDQRLDYLRIHYCHALALNHGGDTARAIEHMEKARSFSPKDSAVHTQLVSLKSQLRREKSRQAKANSSQRKLREKQARRKGKGHAVRGQSDMVLDEAMSLNDDDPGRDWVEPSHISS